LWRRSEAPEEVEGSEAASIKLWKRLKALWRRSEALEEVEGFGSSKH
jgi:hypothetical protein